MAADPGNGIFRGLIHRARSLEEVEVLWRVRAKGAEAIKEAVAKAGYDHLWTEPLPSRIKFDWRPKTFAGSRQ